MRRNINGRHAGYAHAVQSSADSKIALAGDQGSCNDHLQTLAALLEIPSVDHATRKALTETIVLPKVSRHVRSRMLCQIVRRRDDRRPRILADTHRDHILLDAMAGPDAGIEAVAHDISERAVGDDFQGDGRMRRKKFREHRLYYLLRRGARHRKTQMSRRLVTEDVDRFDRRFKTLECRPQLRQEAFADLGRGDAPRSAVEQPDAELFLERPNGFRECRSRDAELTRRLGEARALGDRHECVHLGKSELWHWSDTPTRACRSCLIVEQTVRLNSTEASEPRIRPAKLGRSSYRSGPRSSKEKRDGSGFALSPATRGASLGAGPADHRGTGARHPGDGQDPQHGSDEARGAAKPHERRHPHSDPDARPSVREHADPAPGSRHGPQSPPRSHRLALAPEVLHPRFCDGPQRPRPDPAPRF